MDCFVTEGRRTDTGALLAGHDSLDRLNYAGNYLLDSPAAKLFCDSFPIKDFPIHAAVRIILYSKWKQDKSIFWKTWRKNYPQRDDVFICLCNEKPFTESVHVMEIIMEIFIQLLHSVGVTVNVFGVTYLSTIIDRKDIETIRQHFPSIVADVPIQRKSQRLK